MRDTPLSSPGGESGSQEATVGSCLDLKSRHPSGLQRPSTTVNSYAAFCMHIHIDKARSSALCASLPRGVQPDMTKWAPQSPRNGQLPFKDRGSTANLARRSLRSSGDGRLLVLSKANAGNRH